MEPTKEESIRAEIIPKLNSLANNLWDDLDTNTSALSARVLDEIINDLHIILNRSN